MNNKEKLFEIIRESPDLPIVFSANSEDLTEGCCTLFENFDVDIRMIYFYERFGENRFTDDIIEVEEYFQDKFCDDDNLKNLNSDEFDNYIDSYIENNIKHYKAIYIYIYS